MKYSDLLSYYSTQVGTVNTVWNLYAVVVLGVLGFIVSHPENFSKSWIRIIFLLGFLFFTVGIFAILSQTQNNLYYTILELASQSKSLTFQTEEFKNIITGNPKLLPKYLSFYHLLGDALICLAILFIPKILKSRTR